MITQEIRHHDRNFSIITEGWPEADGAAKAVRWLRQWIESQTPAQTSVLHFVVAARQEQPEARFHMVELDEADEAAGKARLAGLPVYCEEPPRGRAVILRADRDEETGTP